ncbi:hydroxyisourate hydrolase [uncultured Acinetobacter sp.]|uniref:hydroxyisourate hydrolase n=1 Tax=uncultured Acinetobacter sp. TaxID=165433 RepID=UPI0026228F09|nr:hydroxyisourate hydrolase [uncultured Acinetobacter sp.]
MISSHILDTHLGKPAANVLVHLRDDKNTILATATTNQDGRITSEALSLNNLALGHYSLEFFTLDYFKSLNLNSFFPKVVIHFCLDHANEHYHIPLLISPFAYSTYRGS